MSSEHDEYYSLDDYKKLIKAVIDNAISDYCKLQHPKNRNKKNLNEDFLTAVDLFFDPTFEFDSFTSEVNDGNLTTQEVLSIMLDSDSIDIHHAQKHVINKSIDYWWDKNFHDIKIPNSFVIAGKVWRTQNSPNNIYIDWQNQRLYLPLKKRGSDRVFFKQTLEILLKESEITLNEKDLDNFYKLFYLFLKVNDAFT